ncbi:MAG TPA: hypothetical protein PLL98_02835 [Bacillota bacterium]|nr:hypothetical protein [Bacillota bacterium]HOR85401.1 hypothetical protein [Bacillota bacterium]HPL53083.1 hypothetical protein [Bacillota bacterium]
MGVERLILGMLSRLNSEDFLILAVVFILYIENKCDKTFLLIMLLVFLMDMPDGLLT